MNLNWLKYDALRSKIVSIVFNCHNKYLSIYRLSVANTKAKIQPQDQYKIFDYKDSPSYSSIKKKINAAHVGNWWRVVDRQRRLWVFLLKIYQIWTIFMIKWPVLICGAGNFLALFQIVLSFIFICKIIYILLFIN